MNINFAFLQLPMPELRDIYRALCRSYIMEARSRQEQDLEGIEPPALLGRLETLLGLSVDQAHNIFHDIEDELWEYAWYAYTDEWAWHRARQDARRELTAQAKSLPQQELDQLTEKNYGHRFDRYVAEIDMQEAANEKKPTGKKTKQRGK